MSTRKFFLVSLALAAVAVGLHLAALGQFSRGMIHRARAVSVRESERPALKAESSRYLSRGTVIGYVGFAFALSSIEFVVVSARRHERAWRSVTFALLFIYLMLQFLLV